ncbi:MAG: glycosyltransferase family 4 protein [Flavobacteriales bacterium]|nr:glycosyltransferase family 4 protein [Flavobacteriales bacterium]
MSRSLRVLQVIPSLGRGGAERLCLNISSELIKLGHQVEIVVFRDQNDYPELDTNLKVHVIPSQVSYSLLRKDIINTEAFDSFVAKFNPDIVHTHLLETEFVTRHNHLKTAVYLTHWHGCHPPTNPRSFKDYFKKDTWWNINSIRKLKRQYAKGDNQFLCISEFIKGYVERALGPKTENTYVILNGCDINSFHARAPQRSKDSFTLVSVGSFHAYKNQKFLLKVLQHLVVKGITDIQLQLLGDGSERKNLEKFVQENNLSNHVQFLGYVDNPELYMNKADVLVHSAIDEPFGLILLEAMSSQLPIIAFRSGGIPEIVEHGKTGYLTDVNNVEDFAQRILELKNNPELTTQLGKAGQNAVSKFSIDKYVGQIETLYFKLLQKNK